MCASCARVQHIPIPVAVSYLEFLNTRKTQTSAFSSLVHFYSFIFLKKKGSVATWNDDEISSFKFSILL